ncbi:uncharacterized protein LOC143187728 [Calliopsis andreniformis]|uniref:uncharacterized protein LOC143187715 n=1 Tax=Calliopsis andreniformis TaxID=337506 RepID=UPI003FCE3175
MRRKLRVKIHALKEERHQYRAEQRNKNQNIHTIQTTQAVTSNNVSGYAFMTGDYQVMKTRKLTFILDSGASDHIVKEDNVFPNMTILDPPIRISIAKNGEYITASK